MAKHSPTKAEHLEKIKKVMEITGQPDNPELVDQLLTLLGNGEIKFTLRDIYRMMRKIQRGEKIIL